MRSAALRRPPVSIVRFVGGAGCGIGCGGSGKTTLSNLLGDRLDLPVLHIDGFYWQHPPGTAGRVEASPEEWAIIHRSLIERPRWVIDGMKLGTLAARLAVADTVVFLDLPTHVSLRSVLWRRLRRRSSVRPELGTHEVRVSREFLTWIWRFRRVYRPRVLQLLEDCSCEVFVLQSRKEAARFLDSRGGRSLPKRPSRFSPHAGLF